MAHSSQTYGSTHQRTDVPDVGFSPTELYTLSENITTNIYTINNNWRTMEQTYKYFGTSKDNQGLRDKLHYIQLSTNQIVAQTSNYIARLTVLMRRGDRKQKLQIEKLTADFKDALQRYSDIQKFIANKLKRNILATANGSGAQQESGDERQNLQIQEENDKRAVLRELEFEQGLIVERADRIKRIEGDILDVNQIMRELGALVNQQGEYIDTIENSIENVHGNVELGAQELIKASNYQKKFRRKMCILFVVVMIIVVILLVIIFKS